MKKNMEERKNTWNDALLHVRPEFLEEAARPEALAPLGTPEQNRHPVLRWLLVAAAALLLVGVMFTASILGNIAWKRNQPTSSAGIATNNPVTTDPPQTEVPSGAEDCPHLRTEVVEQKATCGYDGYYLTRCKICGKELYRIANPRLPHQMKETTILKPTCTTSGAVALTCAVCGIDMGSYELPPQHQQVRQRETKATCVSSGSIVTYCAVCHEILAEEVLPPTGIHDFETFKKDPTCTEAGVREERCCYCGVERETTVLAPLGHNYDETGACTRCGVSPTGLLFSLNEDGQSYTCNGTAKNYDTTATELVIPAEYLGKPVTAILLDNFDWYFDNITTFHVPSTVKRLSAQYGWPVFSKLSEVTLPEGLEYIGGGFFAQTKLTSIVIPSTVKRVEPFAFACVDSLTDIQILCPPEAIADGAFFGNETYDRMSGYDGPLGLEWGWSFEFGDYAYVKGLGTYTGTKPDFPDYYHGLPVKMVNDDVLRGNTRIEEVTFPGTFNYIQWVGGDRPLAGCTSLKKVTFREYPDPSFEYPDGDLWIESGYFDGCTALETVVLPKRLATLHQDAFRGCTSLKTIIYGGTKAQWQLLMDYAKQHNANEWSHEVWMEAMPAGITVQCTDGVIQY